MSVGGRSLRLAPSLLSADFADLATAIRLSEEGGAGALHLDVMDGHFVPNLTFGPALVRSVRARTSLPLDVHLMIEHPAKYAGAFASAGGSTLVFHAESSDDPSATIRTIRELGVGVGLALKPGTSFDLARPHLDRLDQLLVMSVEPGFSGQAFQSSVLPKVRSAARAFREMGSNADVSIDGGVTVETAPSAAREGATFFVCGNSVFVGGEPVENLRRLRRAVDEGARGAVL